MSGGSGGSGLAQGVPAVGGSVGTPASPSHSRELGGEILAAHCGLGSALTTAGRHGAFINQHLLISIYYIVYY